MAASAFLLEHTCHRCFIFNHSPHQLLPNQRGSLYTPRGPDPAASLRNNRIAKSIRWNILVHRQHNAMITVTRATVKRKVNPNQSWRFSTVHCKGSRNKSMSERLTNCSRFGGIYLFAACGKPSSRTLRPQDIVRDLEVGSQERRYKIGGLGRFTQFSQQAVMITAKGSAIY